MDAFLKRAAVLHSDAAIYADHAKPQDDVPPEAASDIPTTPLLARHRLTAEKDGEILGSVLADWNWPFATSVLDLLTEAPDRVPFLAAWYHATLAFMLGNGWYGEMTPHLERAAVVLPDEPRILFDRACYAEVLGLQKSQVLLSDADILVREGERSGRRLPEQRGRTSPQRGIPLAHVTNAEAERLLRRALHTDPGFAEARVRLARLLEVRNRHEEAAAELSTALGGQPSGPVAFYAHLFAGRAAQALGRIEDAAAHYRAAAMLFPGAQSALVAQSHAALLASDVPGAIEPLRQLSDDRTQPAPADPWWDYALGAGRDAQTLLRQFWAAVPR